MKNFNHILFVLVFCLTLVGQSVYAQVRNPLIPSKRNDRLLQEQAERQERERVMRERQAMPTDATRDASATPNGTDTPQQGIEVPPQTETEQPINRDELEIDSAAYWAPVKVHDIGARDYDELSLPQSSMDLPTPDNVQTTVEYQPNTGYYVLHTKIGDVDVTTPYLMNENEYQQYSEQVLMHNYWQQKISEVDHDNERKFDITDMKFNIGPADRVFGPGGVQLKMQGSAELKFAFNHQYVDNPSLTERSRNNNIFDFDEKIQVNVNGKVGQRLDFQLNYNTEASFAQDQQNLKLSYKGQEDDIIQSIEAGNVTMDLPSNLIRGTQALFGIKTNLKFGKFKVQALVSQQNSTSQNVSSDGGAQMTKFDIDITEYDENKHFFLGYFFRDKYDEAMTTLPYISSGVTINKIEVWVTNKRGSYDQARNIVGFVDLGEAQRKHINNTYWQPQGSNNLPENRANTLYEELTAISGIRDIQSVSSVLENLHGLEGGEDYDKIESARRLNSSEYTLNAALGYISLKSALNQDEVLAVAYEYTYNGQVYQVGEFSTDNNEDMQAPNCLIVKLLKSTANAPHAYNATRQAANEKNYGTWDLMMKNIYWTGAATMSSDKFELYVQYRNDSVGTQMQYLQEGNIAGKQLLRAMGLDRLDQKNNPYPDGRFDYIEGYTVISSNGRIIFPVVEPFGSYLKEQIGNEQIANKYIFPELYDSTLVVASEYTEKNKFRLTGKYKGSAGNEIRLNAMNIPKGSVVVTAGGATLVENVDYTVDYMMGTVTILNQSILESGTSVNVQLENQSTFSLKRKSLIGAHLEYEFNKDLSIGGTIMHLRERPLTTKVNSGEEPLANTIWGLNLNWKTEFQWLSNAIDKIPWITATQPSTLQVSAEFAHLIPGHTNDVGSAGTSYIDDFESTMTGIDVHYPNYWFLASTPRVFAESSAINNLEYGKNRALLNWYVVDPIFSYPQSNTPQHVKNDPDAMSDHRIRIVYQQELFPNKQQLANEDTRLSVLNLSYYPEERGPYNICDGEIDSDGKLTNPRQRWGGMMRRLDNTDFERANVEYIEFWLMDPALTNPDGYDGDLYINLGDISEDILRDGKKAFEHGLPTAPGITNLTDTTIWGVVPKTTSTTVAFSNESGARAYQDVGLNGLSTENEFLFTYKGTRPYYDYVQALRAKITNDSVRRAWEDDPFSPFNDPAGDNFHYYRGSDYDRDQVPVIQRYKHYNGTEGNSPDSENQPESYGTASTLQPDMEDINNDNTLNEYEKYFSYHIKLRPDLMRPGVQHIADSVETQVTLRNGQTATVRWYQFKIPLHGDSATVETVGTIRNFKSIRFMRMYLTGFEHETHLRFATLSLVRGDWRPYTQNLFPSEYGAVPSAANMDVQSVSIETDGARSPINYVLPPGVSRQTDPGQAQLIAQNEQAMVLRVDNLAPHDAKAVYKNTNYDLRNYKKLQMFVHAEKNNSDPNLQNGDLTCFIRLGSDLKYNYYEYEVPLSLTENGMYNNDNENDRVKVWPLSNMMDFPFTALTNAKVARNRAKRNGTADVGNTIPYVVYDDANGHPNNRITVLGNPTIEEVTSIMIGVRNGSTHTVGGEVWVNELRLSEFNEQGGVAAMANVALGISDIAQFNVAGSLETAGYGSIESNVLGRNMDNNYQVSLSAAMEVGRLFPEKAKLQIPAYVSYSTNITQPEYNPLDSDVKLQETLDSYDSPAQKDSIKQLTNTVTENTTFSVTNMKVNIKSKKQDMFYDPANFSISASYSRQRNHSPEIEKDITTDHKGSFNYAYSFNPKPWEPFKNNKNVAKVKLLKEMNFYYLPQSWSFNTNMHRTFSHMKMRDLTGDAAAQNMDLTFSKDFTWDRNVTFKYDLTKNMKFSLQTAHNATIDEGFYSKEIIKDYHFTNDYYEAWKDTIQRSLAKWGKPYTYQQVFTASWSVPFNRIPYIEAISANASYSANYNWSRTASSNNAIDMGNTISSLQTWQIDGGINFETLYGKSKYWKQVTQIYGGRNNRRNFKAKTYSETVNAKKGEPITINHRLGSEMLTVTAADSTGKKIPITFRSDGGAKIVVVPKADCAAMIVSVATRNPNERTAAQVTGDIATYIGTMIRKVQVTYRHTNSMTVAGFMPEPVFAGQQKSGGYLAPGLDFSFGFIPDDFVAKAKRNGWLNGDTSVVQPATRATTSDLDIKVSLEPLPGLKIQLNGKRYAASSTSILYSYDQMQENTTGSFNITQVAIGTMFAKLGNQANDFNNEPFNEFLRNIDIMHNRVQTRYENVEYPNSGFMRGHSYSPTNKYDPANGTVKRTSADVLVPAFLAAYTGRDVNNISFNPILSVLRILPNWSVSFDGLGRLPWMRDHFRSVTLTHAYTCKYAIGSYGSYSTWVNAGGSDQTLGFVRDVATDNPIPSSAYDIANVTITEAFSPLIGINLTMKNSLSLKAEYRKQRNLALNVTSVQLTEGHTDEFVIGAGYIVKNLTFVKKNRDGAQKRVNNDLKLNVDVSYKNINSLLRKVEEGITQISSGNKVWTLKISADYVLSQKINLQFFYDHQSTTPLISTSYPVRADNVGINVKIMLTR